MFYDHALFSVVNDSGFEFHREILRLIMHSKQEKRKEEVKKIPPCFCLLREIAVTVLKPVNTAEENEE